MSYKNNQQMRLVKIAKLIYAPHFEDTLERMKESIRAVYERMYDAFHVIRNVLLERLDSPPYVAYIKLPKRPVAPPAIMPTVVPSVRTVFLPIKRFRGQR